MLTLLQITALTIGITPCLTPEPGYSLTEFTKDCRSSGGAPRLFGNSVVCEDLARSNISCTRAGDRVRACGVGSFQEPSHETETLPPAAGNACAPSPRP